MQAADECAESHIMTVTDMLQAIVTEDDYRRWRKENGIGEKKKKKKKMPRKGLDELRPKLSDENGQTDGRLTWADIIELEERESQSDDSLEIETTDSETGRCPSPDAHSIDRRKDDVSTANTGTTKGLCHNSSESKDFRTQTLNPTKRQEETTENDSSQNNTESHDTRTGKFNPVNSPPSDTSKKAKEEENLSVTEYTQYSTKADVPAKTPAKMQEETTQQHREPASLETENGTSVAGDSNEERAHKKTQEVRIPKECKRDGTRKSGQHRLTVEQHQKLRELRRQFPRIPPLTWQRLRGVMESHPVMLDMQYEPTLTYLNQQPPRVMSKAVDKLRKDCYQRMRNPWNFLQALTEAAAQEYINQSGRNSVV